MASKLPFLLGLILAASQGFSQTLLPVSNINPNHLLYQQENEKLHPAMQPMVLSKDLRDSALIKDIPSKDWQGKNWLFRKIFKEHLVEIKSDDYEVNFDFLPDLWIGKQGERSLWNNTREVAVEGFVGKQFAFSATISENQGKYPLYYDEYVRTMKVVPGQGHAKLYGSDGFDYSNSSANLSYTPSKYLNVQVGYGKNFVGNGYRSVLLSDFAFNYPYVKITATLGAVQYSVMWAQFEDLYSTEFDDETPYPKKYGVFHYLDWNVNKRLSLGLFENIMWEPRGGEWSYFIPILFLRPAEYNNGSPDKVLLGLNGSYKVTKQLVAYGQLAINEFTLREVFSGKGYWANKIAGQIGLRSFDILNVKNLNATVEFNSVRPYTYSASKRIKNYGHYNAPLAHPFGANFREYLAIVNYRYNRWEARMQANFANYGLDENGLNYGKNIFLDYTTRVDDYGVHIGHGLTTDYLYGNATLGFVLNPKNNLRLEAGYTYRREENSSFVHRDAFFTVGLRASFKNLYQDF